MKDGQVDGSSLSEVILNLYLHASRASVLTFAIACSYSSYSALLMDAFTIESSRSHLYIDLNRVHRPEPCLRPRAQHTNGDACQTLGKDCRPSCRNSYFFSNKQCLSGMNRYDFYIAFISLFTLLIHIWIRLCQLSSIFG